MTSSWFRSKTFIILVVVGVLIVAGLLLAPYLFNLERYRETIVSELEKATGRDLEIESLDLHLLPSLHVEAENLRVKNPRGFPAGDTLAVGAVDIGLALGPLLRRELEVTSVTIKGVEVNLLSNEAGATNYELPERPRALRPGEPPAAAPVAVTRIEAVAVEDVRVSSGSFWQRSKNVVPGWSASGIGLVLRGLDLSDPKWMQKLEAEVDLTPVEISSPALKQPLKFEEGTLAVKGGGAESKFTAALGKLRASGTIKVAKLEKPIAEFTLAMKELNTNELAALAGGGAKSGPRAGGGELLARGSVQVERLIAPPLVAQNVRGQARVYGNRIEVDPFSLSLFGGSTRGRLSVDLSQASMPASVNAHVERVDVAQAIKALNPGGKANLTGTFEADARLGVPLGGGNPLAGLGGDGAFAVRNGSFPGLNIEGSLAKMAKLMQMDVPSGDTRFSYFGGDFRIASERVHSRNLELKAETLEASLAGSFGFDETLDYAGSGVLTGKGGSQPQEQPKNPLGAFGRVFGKVMQQTIGRMRVPFSVRGTFQDPKFIVAGAPSPVR